MNVDNEKFSDKQMFTSTEHRDNWTISSSGITQVCRMIKVGAGQTRISQKENDNSPLTIGPNGPIHGLHDDRQVT